MLSNSFVNSFYDFALWLKPNSVERAKDVIEYANRFMINHQSIFDSWQPLYSPPKENLSSHDMDEEPFQNKFLAQKLGNLAKDEISQFFLTLQVFKTLDRGEVIEEYSYPNSLLRWKHTSNLGNALINNWDVSRWF